MTDTRKKEVKLVEKGLANIIVLVALPKNMLGGSSGAFTCFAPTFVIFDETCLEETIE